mgnify:FL=1
MAYIKANTSWSDRLGQAYFTRFEIIEKLPEVGGKYADGIVDKITDASIDKTSRHLHEEWSFHYVFVSEFGDDNEHQYNRYPVAVRKDWEAIEAEDEYGFVLGE